MVINHDCRVAICSARKFWWPTRLGGIDRRVDLCVCCHVLMIRFEEVKVGRRKVVQLSGCGCEVMNRGCSLRKPEEGNAIRAFGLVAR